MRRHAEYDRIRECNLLLVSKETYYKAKETYYKAKETYYKAKETYYKAPARNELWRSTASCVP